MLWERSVDAIGVYDYNTIITSHIIRSIEYYYGLIKKIIVLRDIQL